MPDLSKNSEVAVLQARYEDIISILTDMRSSIRLMSDRLPAVELLRDDVHSLKADVAELKTIRDIRRAEDERSDDAKKSWQGWAQWAGNVAATLIGAFVAGWFGGHMGGPTHHP